MGKKTNPNGVRLVSLLEKRFLSINYNYNWFSDYKYSFIFYQDFLIKKNNIALFLNYYKAKIHFFKGRQKSRRIKSFLRFCNKSFSIPRLPYKIEMEGCFHRISIYGSQRKKSSFVLNTYKKNLYK